MTVSPENLRPGEGGFNPYAQRRDVPFITFAGLAWVAVLVALAVAVVLVLIRLGHHQGRTPTFRPTIGPASWIPAPHHRERAFVILEQPEGGRP